MKDQKPLLFVSLLTLTASFALAAPAPAKTAFTAAPEKGSVEFLAIGKPAMLKIAGKGEGPTGTLSLDGGKFGGELRFKLSTLNTGIDLRDRHMKEKYLKVEQNPTATLKLTSITGVADYPLPGEKKDVPFTGTLELSGKTQPVNGVAQLLPKPDGVGVDAAFDLVLTDYGIEIPSYAGIKVAEKVNVRVRIDHLVAKNEVAAPAPAEPTTKPKLSTPDGVKPSAPKKK